MDKQKFYITTSIAYANAAPHIGFALELLIADSIARYQRLQGKDVYFLTGTDEHGIKIYNTAQSKGVSPQQFVDKVSTEFKELATRLNISHTDFIRTTDRGRHWHAAQKVWTQLANKGDIYLGHYQGYYCVNDEAYITETDYKSGAYDHKTVIELSEDNYMFKLSNYTTELQHAIGNNLQVVPAHRGKEILNFIKDGAEDVSFSRQKDKLPWGIPVPGDENHVMYVWSDALTNYISAIGYADDESKFNHYWPADVQVIGKDILRFHAMIWPAMLTGLGLQLPRTLLVHGFITSSGQKMSKSIGNVVSPNDLIDTYGVDATRYYLLAAIPTFDDGDYSPTRMQEVYTSNLANDLGNLVSRVLTLATKNFDGIIPLSPDHHILTDETIDIWHKHFSEYSIDKAIATTWEVVRACNAYVDATKPWEQAKTNQNAANQAIVNLLHAIKQISVMLYPIIPDTSSQIRHQIGLHPINTDTISLDSELQAPLPVGHQLSGSKILFPRIET